MKEKIVNLNDKLFVGSGYEREAYMHPDDSNRLIKVVRKDRKDKQTKREIRYLSRLKKRLPKDGWRHISHFYGTCMTNLGRGQVVELIRDFNGEISQNFQYYMDCDGLGTYKNELNELREHLLKYRIIFNYDMSPHNLMLRRVEEDKKELVLVDAIGDVVAIPILNISPHLVRKKINRRWERFEKKLLKYIKKGVNNK